jgi:ABC-type cobalamin/Fe3+-siderophores transport system ATPase subunit
LIDHPLHDLQSLALSGKCWWTRAMQLLHYVEIENFKCIGNRLRIELGHPAVLIGPNNCGKTSVIQALALWSLAAKTWYDAKKDTSAKERTSTALNRLSIVSVPVQKTKFFWHNTIVRKKEGDVKVRITVGVQVDKSVIPLTMELRHQGDELVYCTPDIDSVNNIDLIRIAASINVDLLYPMSGLETEEPILQPGRVAVLLGQGQTAQVLRNLCLVVAKGDPGDWQKIVALMKRLFGIELSTPSENARGSIELSYRQKGVKEVLDVSSSGRGFQQMLLLFSYLYSHKRSVLLVDEPDAHLEILRQKQVFVLLRDIATDSGSQVVLVTHSEVILDEALDSNLTMLLDGKADAFAQKQDIRNSLKHFGAEHYVKARERGYVLYVEGATDVDILRELAVKLQHPVAQVWDERVNSFYVQNNYPEKSADAELERVEGGFGITPKNHFFSLRNLLPDLRGLAILDNDGRSRIDSEEGGLTMKYWKRYEAENYFVSPAVLMRFAREQFPAEDLFRGFTSEIEQTMDALILDKIFDHEASDFDVWKELQGDAARLFWESKTSRIKLSDFAEEYFRRLALKIGGQMLLRKGELHRLVPFADAKNLSNEIVDKLDSLSILFAQ